jgi:hypothetical protein
VPAGANEEAAEIKPDDTSLVPRNLTNQERHEAWGAANYHNAASGHQRPIALWILGPSSVGKSTLTAQVGPRFDIPSLAEDAAQGSADRRCLNAVLIDGEFIRDAYGVWTTWTKTPDWRSAYPALKSTINKEKDHMFTEAAAERKHLVIPQTLLNLQKGLDEVEALIWQGYTNHVVAVVAPLDECLNRGRSRENTTGKRYQPKEFERSISAIPPMIMACNGKYEVVQAIERTDSKSMDYRTLSMGPCGNFDVGDMASTPSLPFGEKEVHDLIDVAINSKPLPPLPVEDTQDAALGSFCDTAVRQSLCHRTGSKLGVHMPTMPLDAGRMPRPFDS